MLRRNFLKWGSLLGVGGTLPSAQNVASSLPEKKKIISDRMYWIEVMDKMATPILSNLSRGELKKNMKLDVSPSYGKRNRDVAYLEAFGRMMIGLAPFLALPEDNTEEGKIRKRLHKQSLESIRHGFDPASPDYFYWGTPEMPQPLVDASFFAQALLQAPAALWEPLDAKTKENVIREFKAFRRIKPNNNNWVLFAAIIETFLLSIGEDFNAERIDTACTKIINWYVGDGWYKDGESFHFDHYNAFVIHPMLIDILRVSVTKGRVDKKLLDQAYKRMQRYATYLERYISPEGTYLVVGRSSTYRMASFQPLSKLALEKTLPSTLTPAQVRCALTAVMKRVFIPSSFTKDGWLTLGLVGDQQKELADYYSNTGSMYMTSAVFLPLGLPATDEFWSAPEAEWTQKKAWSGKPFPKDYAVDY